MPNINDSVPPSRYLPLRVSGEMGEITGNGYYLLKGIILDNPPLPL